MLSTPTGHDREPLVGWSSACGGNHDKRLDTPGRANVELDDDDVDNTD